ncbi:MAG: putative manganese transporter [Clostridia bacterium]|nr:putative manganese transporter [Clostridia bacterium]
MTHIIEHSIIDSVKIIPLIFIIYLVIEYFEHRNNTWLSHKLMKTKRFGAVWGALLGSIPQCGFSVIAADMYSNRNITLGTLIAIFIATSDEAVPIILSYPDKAYLVASVIVVKIVIAVICGVLIDSLYKAKATKNICKEEYHHEHFHGNCENCDDGIVKSAIKHTIKIFLFVLIATLLLTMLIEKIGEDRLATYLLNGSVFQPFIAALVGLIPNCAASVLLTQSYLSGAISFGSLIAGLSSGAGVGILLLVKKNRNIRESVGIILLLYLIGALSGMMLQIIG